MAVPGRRHFIAVAAAASAIVGIHGGSTAEPAANRIVVAQADRQPETGHGTALKLEPRVVKAGEAILAEVNVVNVHNYRIEIRPAVRRDGISVQTIVGNPPTDGVNPTSGLFVHEIDTAELELPGSGGFFADPSRGYFDVTLLVMPQRGGNHVPIQTERIFVSRDAEVLSPDRFSVGPVVPGLISESVEVNVGDGLGQGAKLETVRLGRYLPGGAVIVDHPADRPVSAADKGGPFRLGAGAQFVDRGADGIVDPLDEASLRPQRLREDLASTTQRGGRFSVTSPFDIGPFEIRAVGRGGALVGRSPVTFGAP
ncbi:MAG TPA: hypothetical protein VK862_11770, partial [Afifellaceae bacterium]|nr:hypothetical protein [Afifellaceae bacterium]